MGRSLKPSAPTEVLCPRLKQYHSVPMNVFLIQFLRICSKCNSFPVHCCVICRAGYHHDLPIFGIYMFVQLFVLRMATRDFHKIPGAFGQGLSSAFLEDLTCSFFLLDVRLDSNYWSALVSPGRSTCLHIWRCSSWPALTRALMRIIHHNEFIYNLKLRVSFIVKVVNLSLKSCIVTLNCGVARSKKRNITRRIYRNLCSIWVGYQKGFIKMQRRLINLYHVLTFHLNIIILEWFWLCNWTTKPSACGAVIFHYFFLLNEFDYSISLFQEQRLIADSN
jgi:hypothetical protein